MAKITRDAPLVARPCRATGQFARFRADRSGASALEFALIAVPFLLLIFAVLEVGAVYIANFALENAVAQGSRLIRTGEAQTKGYDAGKFKEEVCKSLSAPLTCGGLRLDVRKFANFGGVNLPSPLDAAGNLKSNLSYAPGEGGEIVVVRAFYEWTLAAKLPEEVGLSNMPNGDRLLTATAAFRNEPFPKP